MTEHIDIGSKFVAGIVEKKVIQGSSYTCALKYTRMYYMYNIHTCFAKSLYLTMIVSR